ncbi:MAG: 3-hydroxyisobutyrate dehydrogenase, partial [Alphaproteobacteria bacterium]|nr:3-hydroxyisobutyrate dehydrogenase [Alphaproteobacteria bacterium]
MTTHRIAFFGLGNMGQRMCANLLRAGHIVDAFDPMPDAKTNLLALIEKGDDSAAEQHQTVQRLTVHATADTVISPDSDTVISVLPAGPQVKELCESVIFPAVAPSTMYIDCSTIDVATTRTLAAKAEAHRITMLDAPMSGGIGGAEAATLTFMVGGSNEGFGRALPLLQTMGKTIVHCGNAGAGQGVKICNNMILGASMAVVSEAFALSEKLGIDPQRLYDVSSTSSGQCWALTTYCPEPGMGPPSPANNDWTAGFSAAMMMKDLRLAISAASDVGAQTAVGHRALELYETYVEGEGMGHKDFSGII